MKSSHLSSLDSESYTQSTYVYFFTFWFHDQNQYLLAMYIFQTYSSAFIILFFYIKLQVDLELKISLFPFIFPSFSN